MAVLIACNDAIWRESLAIACAADVGFSLSSVSERLSPAAIDTICTSVSCLDMVAAISQILKEECVLTTATGGIQLYKDLLDPVSKSCSTRRLKDVATTAPTTTPSPPQATRSPRPTIASPFLSQLKTTTAPPEAVAASPRPPGNMSRPLEDVATQARNESQASEPSPRLFTGSGPAQIQADTPPTGAEFLPSPAPALLVSTSSSPAAVVRSDSDVTRVNSRSTPHERLDVNILLVAIACGIVVVSVVGFIAFYVDQKRHREQDVEDTIPSPPPTRLPARGDDDGYLQTGDSYDHFSPIPVWGGKETHVRL